MIVAWEELPGLAGRVVMVDGSFDPLHEGHIAYFEEASKFGHPVLCNIASEQWTSRKHPILLTQNQRASIIDSIRFISFVHCAEATTAVVLSHLRPWGYVKGADWRDRGGIPNEESEICDRYSIKVRYLDTSLNSSSALLKAWSKK